MDINDLVNNYGFQAYQQQYGGTSLPGGGTSPITTRTFLYDPGQITGFGQSNYEISDPQALIDAGITINQGTMPGGGSNVNRGLFSYNDWASQYLPKYSANIGNMQTVAQQDAFAQANATNPNSNQAPGFVDNQPAPLGNVSNATPGTAQVGTIIPGQASSQPPGTIPAGTEVPPANLPYNGLQMPDLNSTTAQQAQGNPQYDQQGQLIQGTGQTTQSSQGESGLNFDQGSAANQANPPQYDQQGQLIPGTGGLAEQANQIQTQANTVLTNNGINPQQVIQGATYKNPYQTFIDTYSDILKQSGLSSVKDQLTQFNQKYTDLQNQKADEIQKINDDPWLTEGIRLKKIDSLNSKYEVREKNLTGQIATLQKMYSDGLDQAKFVAQEATTIAHQQAVLDQQLLITKMQLAEKALEFEATLGTKNIPASYQEYQLAKADGFEGNYNDYQTMDANRKRNISNTYNSASGLNSSTLTKVQALASGFDNNQLVKDYNTISGKYQTIKSILSQKLGGPGDLAIVYEFMKGLDPTSVVRETEYANAAKSGNIFAGIYSQFNGYLKPQGGFLPDNVKNSFLSIVDTKLKTATSQYQNLYNETIRKINNITGQTDGSEYITNYGQAFNGTADNVGSVDLSTLNFSF